MLSTLQAFLLEAAHECGYREVDLGGRLLGQKFKVKGLSLDELQAARKKAIVPGASGADRQDEMEVTRQIIISGCVEPDFSNEEFIQSAGCLTPSELVDKLLLAGEAAKLAREITKASGIGEDINAVVADAKN